MSLIIGRIIGIPVRIHYTLWLVLLLIAWSLAEGYMPQHYPGLGATTYWAIGIVSAIILFVSVFLHELSHSYIAKKNGLPIKRITLFFFGGVSELSEEPKDPALEVRMAAAGPLTSFLIAIVLGATANATRVSEGISLLMMAVGLFFIVFGNFINGLWIIFLGWFIRSGAETSLRQTRLTESLAGVRVGEIMTRELLSVSPDASVQQLVSDYFLVHPHGGYPVISNGKLLGVVTMSSVRSIPREKREVERVSEAMIPYERTITVSPTTLAIDALQLMAKNGVGRLVVMDGDRIAGMVTRGDLMKTMKARQDLGLWDHTHV